MECGNAGGGGGEEKEEEENGTGRGVQQVLRKKRGCTVPGTWCTTVPGINTGTAEERDVCRSRRREEIEE